MEFHELANIFTMLGEEELVALCADIEKNGLAEPITLYEGKILDGRNRARACERLGIKPKTVEYTGNDPVAFVLSKNLHRRHLSESQRAMVAIKLANMRQGERTDIPKTFRKFAEGSQETKSSTQSGTISQPEAAKMLNVSERQVQNAAKLCREAPPEVIEQVERGEKTIHAALPKRMPKEQPRRKTVAKEPEPERDDEIAELEASMALFYEMCVGKKPEKFLKIPMPNHYATESRIFCVCYADSNDELKRKFNEETEKLSDALYDLTHPE